MLHAMPQLGPLLASGRDADIFAYGPDLVVRRSRHGYSLEREAKVMQYVTTHGYPAPRVEDVRAGGDGCVVHLDLHPLNVILASRGPVLIDWTNARRGASAADVAATWLVLAAA